MTSKFVAGLGQCHPVATLAECPGRLEAGGPATDHKNAGIAAPGAGLFRVPAAAPLLARGRILGAAHGHGHEVRRDADVAADTLADVVDAPLLDLLGKEGVGDRWPGGADEVRPAAPDQAHHAVDRRVATHRHHGLARHLLHPGRVVLLEPLLGKAGGLAVVFPLTQVDIPEIRQVGQQFHRGTAITVRRDALITFQLIDGQAQGNPHGVADSLPGVLEHLANETHPVLDRSTILVGPRVVAARQEVLQQAQVVSGIDIDNVETGLPGPQHGLTVPMPETGNVGTVHGPCLARIPVLQGDGNGRHGHLARQAVVTGHAAVDQFTRRQRAVAFHAVDHSCHDRNVLAGPQARLDGRRDVTCVMEVALLGGDHRPAALGLHAAHGRHGAGIVGSHAVAVRHLVEAIACRDRSYGHRFEQDVVLRITAHGRLASGCSLSGRRRPG